jgi:hypothetical protein
MTKDKIFLSRGSLKTMFEAKEEELEKLTSSFQDAQGELLQLLQNAPPYMYKMLIEPALEHIESEEDMARFAKLLVYLKRLQTQMSVLSKELYVYKAVLDDESPVHMAGVSFDGMEVLSDDPGKDSRS